MRLSPWLIPAMGLAAPTLAKSAVAEVEDTGPKSTKFNNVEVPPMTQLTFETVDEDTKSGYW